MAGDLGTSRRSLRQKASAIQTMIVSVSQGHPRTVLGRALEEAAQTLRAHAGKND